jgi:predicted esterase
MICSRMMGVGLLAAGVLVGCGGSDAATGGSSGSVKSGSGGAGSLADSGSASGGGGSSATAFGTCRDTPPAGAPQAPDPKPYTGGACPTLTTGSTTEATFTSSGVQRKFIVVVPDGLKPGEKVPVIVLWHWLGGSAAQFYQIADGQNAANQGRFIAVFPDAIGGTALSPGSNPISKWRGWAAPNPQSMEDEEAAFFDDMLSCISAQFPVNKNCVSSAGVSDGALWTSQLIGLRSEYLSSAVVLSGGVAEAGDVNASLIKPYIPAARPLPVLALWGGADDICIILKFQTAMKALETHLQSEGHFVVECEHNCGHSVPPVDVVPGQSLLAPFIDFIEHHPYWTTPGHSPYESSGLPAGMPSWCAIGIGNAVERTGACPSALGCPVLNGG